MAGLMQDIARAKQAGQSFEEFKARKQLPPRLKMIMLPRQARDKHMGNSQESGGCFSHHAGKVPPSWC